MKTELLSPAGDMRSAAAAIMGGADAIYLGGRAFGARAAAQNFSYAQMTEAIAFAHTFGVRAYVTVNTLIYERETAGFLRHVQRAVEAGADALIMQDIGMMAAVRRRFPDIALHASTQMHNHSDAALEFAKAQGAARAVLAREMSIEQIGALQCDIEKEVFVHGALCICFSGQCLMSALTQRRSGNRGACAQSCRMRYRLTGADGREWATRGGYLLSPKDLGLFGGIGRLLEAGIGCFKIEGRLKSPEYVGLVTRIYAGLLAQYRAGRPLEPSEADIEDLRRLFNRGFSKGHLMGARGEALMSKDRPNHRGTPLGRVVSANKERIALRIDAPLSQGDGVKFERRDEGFICNRIYRRGRLVSGAAAGETVELDAKAKTRAGDTVVKTGDALLLKRLQRLPERRVPIGGRLTARAGQPLALVFWDEDGHEAAAAGEIAAPSRTSAASMESLRQSAAKLGDTPYILKKLDVNADEGLFIAKSALNALRRDAAQRLTALRTALPPRRVCGDTPPPVCGSEDNGAPALHVLVRSEEQFEIARGLAAGDVYTEDEALYFARKAACPRLRLKTDRMKDVPAPFSGERLLVTDSGGLHVYPRANDVALDYFVSALNARTLAELMRQGARRVALSPELDVAQTAQMIGAYRAANGREPALEAIVWGRYELMAMRHCVACGALGDAACAACVRQPFALEDIKGNRYPVLIGADCRSRILQSRPHEADTAALLALGVRHFRVELFDEDAAQTQKLLRRFLRLMEEAPC